MLKEMPINYEMEERCPGGGRMSIWIDCPDKSYSHCLGCLVADGRPDE